MRHPLTLLATGAALMAGLASAETESDLHHRAPHGGSVTELEGELHVGWNSEYVWRGIDQGGRSMVEAGVDFGTDLGNGFAANAGIWYATVNGVGAFDEVDYYGGVSKDLDLGLLEGTLEVGYIHYDFPTGGSNLEEIYFSASTELMGLGLGITHYWAIDGDNDGYTEATADWSTELNDCCSLNIGLLLSYDVETSDIHHYGATVSLDYALNDVLTITPYVSVTMAEDGAEMGALSITGTEDDEVVGGIILTAGF